MGALLTRCYTSFTGCYTDCKSGKGCTSCTPIGRWIEGKWTEQNDTTAAERIEKKWVQLEQRIYTAEHQLSVIEESLRQLYLKSAQAEQRYVLQDERLVQNHAEHEEEKKRLSHLIEQVKRLQWESDIIVVEEP